jgi:methyl-accepting chemotaxis protein
MALSFMKKVSLNIKIMGLAALPMVLILFTFVFVYQSAVVALEEERDRAKHLADTIAFNGAIREQSKHLEKQITDTLNTKELVTFLANQQTPGAKMILSGLFLSLTEKNIARFTLYSSKYQIVLEETGKRPKRNPTLPNELQGIFVQAASDFKFHFYFRGNEGVQPAFPVEYCAVSVVTDNDDNPIGFIELTVKASGWLEEVATLTDATIALYNPQEKAFSASSNGELTSPMAPLFEVESTSHSFIQFKADNKWYNSDLLPIQNPAETTVSFLVVIRDVTSQIITARKNLIFAIALTALIIVLTQIFTFTAVRRSIILPIRRVVDFAANMASGDMTSSLAIRTNDEINEMGVALNTMLEHIRQHALKAEAIATGDLSTQITLYSDKDILGISLQRITTNLGEIMEGLKDKSLHLLSEATRIGNIINDLGAASNIIGSRAGTMAQSSETISSNMEVTTNATAQMSSSIQEISESTNKSSDTTQEARRISVLVAGTINKLNTAVINIAKSNQAISGFANQTNLLALNATIEAARAGEAGKGFAVVASEVKDLANQSMSTAKSIHNDVSDIEQHTKSAMEAIDLIRQVIIEASEASMVVASAVTEQAVVANDIADSISRTNKETQTFIKSIEDINHSINDTEETYRDLAMSTNRLSQLATDLETTVNAFTLG